MNEARFASGIEAQSDKEQPVKPFIKKIEARNDFVCRYDGCDKEIKKGEDAWLVLTQRDIDLHPKINLPDGLKPQVMCEDCMEKKIVNDSEHKE